MDDTPLMPALADLPDAVRDLRDDRWRRFVWGYVFNGANGAAAARAAGFSDAADGAKVRAHALLQRDDIQGAIEALSRRYLFSLAPKAILKLDQLLDDPRHPKHDKAIGMVLERTAPAKSQVDVNVTGSVQVNHTDAALEDLRRLVALNVPREKLVEVFGHSGLERYEKMLVHAANRIIDGPPRVIEATAAEVTDA